MENFKKFNENKSNDIKYLMDKYNVNILPNDFVMMGDEIIGRLEKEYVPSGNYFLSSYEGDDHPGIVEPDIFPSKEDAIKELLKIHSKSKKSNESINNIDREYELNEKMMNESFDIEFGDDPCLMENKHKILQFIKNII